ncbi:trypsin-like peptidase domain-containing protein [Rhodopirellula sp. JC737]|nr:trypsin-like peptidase domain-containing protein [Rhodopirellula sp. JC737]MCC9656835.1 trypsin-like peptidase domain-containing protein [Rhodopirellula sp. JC737]
MNSISRPISRIALGLIAMLTVGVQHNLHAQTSRAMSPGGLSSAASAVELGNANARLDGARVSTAMPNADQIDVARERLFDELAEEFEHFDRLGNLVRRVSHLVKPSVIHIEAHKTQGTGASAESFDEAGSGVVLDVAGESWVLTNRHVIKGAAANQIVMRTSDGRRWVPETIRMDPNTDVAVMKLAPSVAGVQSAERDSIRRGSTPLTKMPPAARLADSNQVQIGDFVIAIGSPFGLSHSVTFGILSAKGRRDLSLGEERIDLQDFFQTDAAINPGNSGGPLLNLRGEVIALNTAIASSSGGSEGIGFAIPINMAARVAEELIVHGRLRRGYLGVTLDPNFAAADLSPSSGIYASMKITPDFDSTSGLQDEVKLGGARVKDIRPGSPAEKAHLQRGDIILQFDSIDVEDDDHLVALAGMAQPGERPISMVILRDGKRYRTEVTLTFQP